MDDINEYKRSTFNIEHPTSNMDTTELYHFQTGSGIKIVNEKSIESLLGG
jgi:hypothetical protein